MLHISCTGQVQVKSNRVCYFLLFGVSLASKKLAIQNSFIFTAADDVSSGGRKMSALTSL